MIQQNQTTSQDNNTVQQPHQTASENDSTIASTTIPTTTITPPIDSMIPAIPPLLLRCSPCLLAHQNAADKVHFAFLSQFSPLCESHNLLPLNFDPSHFSSRCFPFFSLNWFYRTYHKRQRRPMLGYCHVLPRSRILDRRHARRALQPRGLTGICPCPSF